MKLSLKFKLVLTGVILLLVPLGALTIISVIRTTDALQQTAREEMLKRTSEIADSISNVLRSEEKFVQSISLSSITVEAFSHVGGNPESTAETGFEKLDRELNRLQNDQLTGVDYQVLLATDRNGLVRAASSPDYFDVDLSDRKYIQTALSGKINIGQAARNKVTNDPFIPVAAPVRNSEGEVVGAVASIMKLDFLWELIKNSTRGKTGYTYVTDANAIMIAHPDPATLFELDISKLEGMGDIVASFKRGEAGYEHYIYKGEPKTAGFDVVKITGWGVFLTQIESDFMSSSIAIRNLMILVSVIAFIAAVIVFFIFAGTITGPVKQVGVFAGEIAEGLLYTRIDVKQKDEIGDMARTLQMMQEKLRDVISGVIESSEQVSSGSQQLAMSAIQLSEGATEQAANAEEVSSSVEQMSANIMQNTDNSAKTEEIASQAAVDIENGGAAVLEAVESMNAIAEKIGIIEEIARNTNLLSLNAAIEAARAGEHGKGFAVVASEVGKLAATSQKAALEIQELAKRSVEKSNAAGEKIKTIVPDIRRTAELVAEISASSHEQNSGADQINSAMIQLDNVIQQNASASEEVSSMSEELSSQAENLLDMTRFFRMSDERLLLEDKGDD